MSKINLNSRKFKLCRTLVKNKKTRVRVQRGYHVQDIDWKTLFKCLSKAKVIKIINELFSTNFKLNSNLEFIDTESSLVTGFEDKGYVRSDLIAKIKKKKKNSKVDTIIIEFQSNSIKSMGYRMFIYTLNHSTTYVKNGVFYCEPAQAITIYSNFEKPLAGFDIVNIREYEYEILDTFKFKPKRNKKFYTLKYPFINILAMLEDDLASLEKTELDVFNILYLYRYKRKKELLLDGTVNSNIENAKKIVNKYNSGDFEVLSSIFLNIIKDIENILTENEKEDPNYGKVLNTMQNKYAYIKDKDILKLRLDFDAQMAKLEAENKINLDKAKAKVKAKAKAEAKAELAKKMAEKDAETKAEMEKKDAEVKAEMEKKDAEAKAELAKKMAEKDAEAKAEMDRLKKIIENLSN